MAKVQRVLLAASVAVSAGCSGSASIGGADAGDAADDGAVRGDVIVFAAASLSAVFADIETRFETAHPAVDVVLNIAGSSSLAVSIEQGAPADVLATANADLMERLRDGGDIDRTPIDFATNDLTMAVTSGRESDITSLDDFSRDELLLGVCASQVPCGSYAEELFALADVDAAIDTRTTDVRNLVTLIAEGELDAGIVYATDIIANSDSIREVGLPDGIVVRARYPIAALADAPNPAAAQRFVEFVASDDSRSILADAGFGTP